MTLCPHVFLCLIVPPTPSNRTTPVIMEKENRGDSRPVAPSPKFDHIMILPEVSLGPGAQAFPIGVDEDEGDEGDAVYFQNWELPKPVKSRVDAEVQQASAFSVTTALYAGVLLSLVQLEYPQQSTAAWEALRFFTYSAITVNLTGTALALVIIKLCSDLESSALQLAVTDPESLPARVMKGGKVKKKLLGTHYELLEQFGMPEGYRLLDFLTSIWIMTGNIFTLTSVTMWVWLAEKKALAGTTMIITGPAILGLAYAFVLTGRHRKTINAKIKTTGTLIRNQDNKAKSEDTV